MAILRESSILLIFLSALYLQSAVADIICEQIPRDMCGFAVASSGQRCVLETAPNRVISGVEYQCSTSQVVVENAAVAGYVETDRCVAACRVDRKSVGISSDAFFEPMFIAGLCSPDCHENCPNIVDLYFNLAAGEGVYLPELCNAHSANPRRDMIEILSSGAAISSAPAPAPSPM